ncbi:GNAT family N-acetyltransferase [Dyadobacter bucti]|uniref:GNAT family N-acetyltransferase n=1 Tax=Dyadobacter bucti TaxID=2572203 RepID=UPI003F715344
MALDYFRIVRLSVDSVIKPFDCGDNDLNEFLLQDAIDYQKAHLAVTYILENKDDTIDYFSVQNDKIALEDFPSRSQYNKARSKIAHKKSHKSYPAVKIGRLGVGEKFTGKGYGRGILDFVKIMFLTNNRTGCRFMLVDAYNNKIDFYKNNGFKLLRPFEDKGRTQLMFCDLLDYKDPIQTPEQ